MKRARGWTAIRAKYAAKWGSAKRARTSGYVLASRTGRRASRSGRKASRRRHIRGFKQLTARAKWSGTTWPRILMKKFEYEDTQLLDSTAGNTSVSYTYRTMSLYDPDASVGTGQNSVINFASFLSSTGPYTRYRCMAAKVTVTFTNVGGSMAQIQPVIQRKGPGSGELVVVDGLGQADFDQLSTLPAGGEPLFIGPLTGGNNIKKRSWYIVPWLAMGMTRAQFMADDSNMGKFNATPANGVWLSLVLLGLQAQAQVHMRVKIVYYTVLEFPYQVVNHNALTDVGASIEDDPPL